MWRGSEDPPPSARPRAGARTPLREGRPERLGTGPCLSFPLCAPLPMWGKPPREGSAAAPSFWGREPGRGPSSAGSAPPPASPRPPRAHPLAAALRHCVRGGPQGPKTCQGVEGSRGLALPVWEEAVLWPPSRICGPSSVSTSEARAPCRDQSSRCGNRAEAGVSRPQAVCWANSRS